MYITAPGSMTQGTSQKKGGRKKEPEDHEVCCEAISPRNGCIDKTGTMAISIDLLTQKRIVWHPTPGKEIQPINDCWEKEKESSQG